MPLFALQNYGRIWMIRVTEISIMRRIPIGLLKFLFLTLLLTSTGIGQDFLHWNEKQSKDVFKKTGAAESFGSILGHGMAGSMGSPVAHVDTVVANWITEPTSGAIGRLIQLAERKPEARATEIAEHLRRKGQYALIVGSLGSIALSSITVVSFDKPDTRAPSIVFLQDKKDEKRFARLKAIQPIPDSMNAIWPENLTKNSVVMIFESLDDDGKPLVQSLNQEIQLIVPLGGRTRTVTFKLKDFPIKSLDEL
jgi:hypothetical protein